MKGQHPPWLHPRAQILTERKLERRILNPNSRIERKAPVRKRGLGSEETQDSIERLFQLILKENTTLPYKNISGKDT